MILLLHCPPFPPALEILDVSSQRPLRRSESERRTAEAARSAGLDAPETRAQDPAMKKEDIKHSRQQTRLVIISLVPSVLFITVNNIFGAQKRRKDNRKSMKRQKTRISHGGSPSFLVVSPEGRRKAILFLRKRGKEQKTVSVRERKGRRRGKLSTLQRKAEEEETLHCIVSMGHFLPFPPFLRAFCL